MEILVFKFSKKAKKFLKDSDKCDDLFMRMNYINKGHIYRDNVIPEDEIRFTYTINTDDVSGITFRFKKLMILGDDHGLFSDKKTIKGIKKAHKELTKYKAEIEELLTIMKQKTG